MKWWPFKKKTVDERIEHTRNKIYKEMYIIVSILCAGSIIVKNFFLDQDISLMRTELVLLLVTSIYYAVRSVRLGLYSDEVEVHDRTSKVPMSMKNVIWGVGIGVALALFFGVRNSLLYADSPQQTLWYFILIFFVTIMMYIPVFVLFTVTTHSIANRVSKRAAQDVPED